MAPISSRPATQRLVTPRLSTNGRPFTVRTMPTLGSAHVNRTQAWWWSARNAIVGIVSLIACSNVPPAEPQIVGEGTRIFFIGNSLTYVNDVPGMLQALADSGSWTVPRLACPRRFAPGPGSPRESTRRLLESCKTRQRR